MTSYARIENSMVVERLDTDGDITQMFHPALVWVECDAAVQPGWTYDGMTFLPPPAPPVPSLADRQAQKWIDIKAERERRTRTGGYLVGTKWFHSDPDSRIQQIGLVMMGASISAGLQWKTMDGSFVAMTQTLAAEVFAAAAASDEAIFAKAEEHNAAMLQSETPEAYDHLAGWPKVFGE